MEQSDFDKLLDRYLHGEVSARERAKIEAWLDQNKSSADKNIVWSKADEDKLFRKITASVNEKEKSEKTISLPATRIIWSLAAACIIGTIAVMAFFWTHQTEPVNIDVIASKHPEKIFLNDGSIIWLSKGSHLSYVNSANVRAVSFAGEAFFEVAKDPQHPFVISCGSVQAKVLGTSFVLRSGHDSVALRVLTGKVNLSTGQDGQGVDVMAHEAFVYARENRIVKAFRTVMTMPETKALVHGTEYDMDFTNSTMSVVVQKLTSKFDVDVTVENEDLLKCRITADLTDRSLEETLRLISEFLDMKYSIDERNVLLSGRGCN